MGEAEAVFSVQGLLRRVVLSIQRTCPYLDYDELVGEGQLIVLKAVRSHDPSRGKLTTIVQTCLVNHFRTFMPSRVWQERMARQVFPKVFRQPSTFDLDVLMFGLSDEAKEAIRVALSGRKGARPEELANAVRRYFGWDAEIINRVFAEIRGALE